MRFELKSWVDKNILTVLLAKGYVEKYECDGMETFYQTTDKGDALIERLLNNSRL